MLEQWRRCRDTYAGTDAVKEQRINYLPCLEGQTPNDDAYKAYLARALFFPAVERTVSGLIGTATRKPPVVLAPKTIAPILDDLTTLHDNFQAVLVKTLAEVLLVGRVGIFIDWNEDLQRPHWTIYTAEQIVNWREERVDGVWQPTLVVIEEQIALPGRDPWSHDVICQYRELRLGEVGVEVAVWRKGGAAGEYVPAELPRILSRNGLPLRQIPFVGAGPRGIGLHMQKPPLLDLVDMNLSHYRSSADLEHGRHFTALPTPFIIGWAAAPTMAIGSGVAWVIPNEQAKVGMLEFTGQGLGALVTALESKEKLMAVVGARLLEQQPRQAETADAVRLRQAGEHSALGVMVSSLSAAMTLGMQHTAFWMGMDALGNNKVEVQLNRDFAEMNLEATEAQALMGLWQGGAISYETLYWNLQQGEWARPGVTWEEEKEMIGADDLREEMKPDPPVLPGADPKAGEDPSAGDPVEEDDAA